MELNTFPLSSNVEMQRRNELSERLGVNAVEQHSKYLGLPTLIGRSKKHVFTGILERVLKKMKDWKEKSLSQAGKEVLLKSVIQSIPTYAMNCFLFPITFCQEIERAAARFFWGSSIEDRKCHWASWDVLTTKKANGGIGFRELHCFNIAMLAKQFWKLIQQPNSLAAQILKAKYSRQGELLHAQLGFKPSYLWRSLVSARELVLHGMAWRTGNGKQISIRKDRWIGIDLVQKIEGVIPEEMNDAKVQELIDSETGEWKQQVIKNTFNIADAEKILQIPLSRRLPDDRRLWRFDKNGKFTVKSAYHAAVQMKTTNVERHASSSSPHVGWRKLWDIKALPRVKMFMWKACTNSLPTRENLARRRCIDDTICGVCGEDNETVDHLLLHCPMAARVWYGCSLRINVEQVGFNSIQDMVFDGSRGKSPEYVSLLAYTAWEIWNHRNRLYFDNKPFVLLEVIQRAEGRWREEMAGWQPIKDRQSREEGIPTWNPPAPGKYKMNTDVAVSPNARVGLGFVIRKHDGDVELAGKCEIQAAGNTDLLEGLAVRYGLKMARQYHKRVDLAECDNKRLVEGVREGAAISIYCDVVAEDIKQLMLDVGCERLHYIPRVANRVAHNIAHGPNFISIGHNPRHIRYLLQSDVMV